MSHKQVSITLPNSGETIQVDKELKDLILYLNQRAELKTYFSCEGELKNDRPQSGYSPGSGYVVFGGPCYIEFASELIREINKERKLWKKDHQHSCHGCRSMTLQVTADGSGNGEDQAVLRWCAWDKDRAIRALKTAYDRL